MRREGPGLLVREDRWMIMMVDTSCCVSRYGLVCPYWPTTRPSSPSGGSSRWPIQCPGFVPQGSISSRLVSMAVGTVHKQVSPVTIITPLPFLTAHLTSAREGEPVRSGVGTNYNSSGCVIGVGA